eukprot:scaffold649981_cov55-Prasinocladus_malaysianus.AAC.1
MTRFENPVQLPFGINPNASEYAAQLLSQISYEPKIAPVLACMAQTTCVELRDPSLFLAPVSPL